MLNLSFIVTLYAGFTHAFETDHLLAVSNIVTTRNKTSRAVKDGLFWGLGHTSTLLIVGVLVLVLRFALHEELFRYFEAFVGCMLIVLGVYRIRKWHREKKPVLHTHLHQHANGQLHHHTHLHLQDKTVHEHSHLPAYHIGLVHGLAGSGSLMVLIIGQSATVMQGLSYLLFFGLGSVGGMMLAAGLVSLPFSRIVFRKKIIQQVLILLSAGLCIVYGAWVIYQQLKEL